MPDLSAEDVTTTLDWMGRQQPVGTPRVALSTATGGGPSGGIVSGPGSALASGGPVSGPGMTNPSLSSGGPAAGRPAPMRVTGGSVSNVPDIVRGIETASVATRGGSLAADFARKLFGPSVDLSKLAATRPDLALEFQHAFLTGEEAAPGIAATPELATALRTGVAPEAGLSAADFAGSLGSHAGEAGGAFGAGIESGGTAGTSAASGVGAAIGPALGAAGGVFGAVTAQEDWQKALNAAGAAVALASIAVPALLPVAAVLELIPAIGGLIDSGPSKAWQSLPSRAVGNLPPTRDALLSLQKGIGGATTKADLASAVSAFKKSMQWAGGFGADTGPLELPPDYPSLGPRIHGMDIPQDVQAADAHLHTAYARLRQLLALRAGQLPGEVPAPREAPAAQAPPESPMRTIQNPLGLPSPPFVPEDRGIPGMRFGTI